MTVVVTVVIPTDPLRARQVEAEHAPAHRAVLESARRHGMLSHRRLYRDDEVLDIDEWETGAGREAFLVEAAPHLQELRDARGSGAAVSKVWQIDPDALANRHTGGDSA